MAINKTILVVDDHEDDRVLLKQLLEPQGYQVLLAENGEHAQKAILSKEVDLVLSDLLMPVVDGIQLCKFIKSSDNLKHIPVVLYSSIYSEQEDSNQALAAGAEHYMIKPIDSKKLLNLLSEVIASTNKTKSNISTSTTPLIENKEQQLRLYSTQLVYRLEKEVDKLKQEITKRKRLEVELVNAKQYAEITLNSIGDAVITTDKTGLVTSMNPNAEKLTGWSMQEALGQSLKIVFPIVDASTRQAIENPIEKIMANGETVSLSNHTTLIAKNGREYQIADSAAPIRNGGNIVLGMVLVFSDVTEQYELREQAKLTQKTLQEKEIEQREIIDCMVNAVISIDENGAILSFNKAAEHLFGYNFNEVTGLNIKCLMPEPYSSKHDGYIKNYLQTGEARLIGLGKDVKGKRKDQSVFPMRLAVAELPKQTNGKRRFIGTCSDLTQVQMQEEQLRRTKKMSALGRLTGGIAHDFNNMLGVIMGYSEILKTKLIDRPKLVDYVEQILHAGARGAKLTKKLLSFSQIRPSEAIEVNLNNILTGQQDLLQKTLTIRIKLLFKLADNLWSIWLDDSDLEDAIFNICINAMHSMTDNRFAELTIQTSNQTLSKIDAKMLGLEELEYVQLRITDNGTGMDEVTKEKIFDPFFSTKGKDGSGLGLSQVFGFVKRSGGTIKVYSELNHGSEFVVYFPRYRGDPMEKGADIGNVDTVMSGDESILVVDDEEALRILASELLSEQGYKVFSAEGGERALRILENEHVDLIFSDVVMPDMDGYQLAEIVQSKYPHIKIQLASGFTDNRHENHLDKNLQKNTLPKPYTSNLLLKSIRALLEKK